jgi:hypothetical protein
MVSRDWRNVISKKGADTVSRTIAAMATGIENVARASRKESGRVKM